MKKQAPWDDTYKPINPVAYAYLEQATELLFDTARRAKKFAPAKCRDLNIIALESYVKLLDGDNARRLRVTLKHLRGELPVVPLSLS
jgi:hypothetical protein